MANADDRRSHQRLPSHLTVEVGSDHGFECFSVSDVSEGGVFIRGQLERHAVGETVQVRVLGLLGGHAVAVPAELVRNEADGAALRFLG